MKIIESQNDSFFNNIHGIFISVDKESRYIKLCGNNNGILGINEDEIIMKSIDLEKFVDEKYGKIFRALLNDIEPEKVSIEVKIKNNRNEKKWFQFKESDL